MLIFNLIILFLLAISIGSFINMAAYRIPLQLSIVAPRSYCNHCKQTLSLGVLIPVFGYILARGKCIMCKVKVPLEYVLIELLCGGFFVFAFFYYDAYLYFPYAFSEYVHSGLFIQLITAFWLFSSGLLLSIIDYKHYILPDIIVLPGIFINLILGSLNPMLGFQQSLLGACVGGFGLYAVSKLYEIIRKKEGMGFGDVKYLAFLGAALGVYGVVFAIFLASILGSIIGIGSLLVKKQSIQTPIPFGPFLAFSGLVYLLLSKNFTIL